MTDRYLASDDDPRIFADLLADWTRRHPEIAPAMGYGPLRPMLVDNITEAGPLAQRTVDRINDRLRLLGADVTQVQPHTANVIGPALLAAIGNEHTRSTDRNGDDVCASCGLPFPCAAAGEHASCPPEAHDRTAGDEQAVDEHGLMACNDCGEPIFYCERTGWYHHVDPAAMPCFLIQ